MKSSIYNLLEDKMLRYSDLLAVPVNDSGEDMVKISVSDGLMTRQIDENMSDFTSESIFVREGVREKLKSCSNDLRNYSKDYFLEIVYGYRPLEIQTKLFNKFKTKLSKKFSGEELMEAVHRLIAVPIVSGHPTGGAIDIQIIGPDGPLDMETKIWEFTNDSYTFSPFINKIAWKNRQLLRRIMLQNGFAPFDGEWWHFSYGDKEWAKFYNKDFAIYSQVKFEKEKFI